MWQEPDHIERANLIDALKCATAPIQEAMKYFEWEGDCLTCGPDTLQNHKEHWRNLYFYLSGYGDSQFQSGEHKIRQRPVAIPQGDEPKNVVVVDGTEHAACQLCGKIDELRPYGPNGESVCFDCMKKDEPAATRQFAKLTDNAITLIK